ncbi:PP2C family protein-serine/threonine phosphatase [Polyangium jinanense]|uniref:Protein phosphatase 2C domain-containing protein n=1 Tax=Polyangium jinanense TaxID=2829994 RepID=A0A9X4AS42_9BACT|nr:protein phosphatase 2C domain-containing protein [Polyangium jinanense]MDC3957360.1 protein phosphatase 2C domain-containing protein [Polyangium jinanense]MDC3982763.1 protein phosphatase 2C domain-containing protein [Polyangium jinanense]
MSQPQALGTRVRIEFAQASDPGRDPNKQVNEDSCGYAETRFGHLVVLCDGMGGHYGGREASRTAIATIFEVIDQAPAGATAATALKAAIEEAGRRVYQLGGPPENRGRPGSTVVAMLIGDRGLDVAHVGDSRAYCIRAGQIYPLTRDHSMVQGMIDAGMLTEAEAIGHPDANKITRALGMRPEVEVEVRPEPMEMFPGDIFLQSSDGLTDLVLGVDILGSVRQALASGALPHACNQLVNLANDRGGHDNITVQMVRIVELAPRASHTIPQAPAPAIASDPAGPRPAPPQETRPMTAVDTAAAAAGTKLALPPPVPVPTLLSPNTSSAAPTAPEQGGLPLPPPSPSSPGFAPVQPTAIDRPVAPSPTMPEQPRLAPYAAQLPLPPPSARYAPAQATQVTGQGPSPTHPPDVPKAVPSAPLSAPAGARPSQAGIVYVIIGMSAVIAVLLLLLIWALFLR